MSIGRRWTYRGFDIQLERNQLGMGSAEYFTLTGFRLKDGNPYWDFDTVDMGEFEKGYLDRELSDLAELYCDVWLFAEEIYRRHPSANEDECKVIFDRLMDYFWGGNKIKTRLVKLIHQVKGGDLVHVLSWSVYRLFYCDLPKVTFAEEVKEVARRIKYKDIKIVV